MSDTVRAIDAETTINEAIRDRPETVAVFHRFGLDSCCGGSLPIRVAAQRHGLDPDEVFRALDAASNAGGPAAG
jgi:iron-sulfur cluster repair protein YtfE (RIC family)